MKFSPLNIEGAFLIELDLHVDERGFFARSFCEEEFENAGLWSRYPQHNLSYNENAGTVRGLHYQKSPHEEVKVVSCIKGAIFDVIVDLRPESKTYLEHVSIELAAGENTALYVPEGIAHGFQTLIDETTVSYLMGRPYKPDSSAGFRWDDPAFNIEWPNEPTMISDRDANYPDFVSPG